MQMNISLQTLGMIHDATHVLTMPLAVIMGLWYGPKYGYDKKKAASYSLTMMIIIVLFTYACKWVPGWFGFTVFINAARTCMFIPLFTLILSRFWNISTLHGADFMTPIIFFVRTVVLIGCNLVGCGLAIPCDWGIYNPSMGCRVFPMDFIDLLGTFAAGVISLIYAKRLNYSGNGRIFSLAMYILGFVRLFIQLGSMEVWWIRGFNDESIYSIVSIVMAIVIYRRYEKINSANRKMEETNYEP